MENPNNVFDREYWPTFAEFAKGLAGVVKPEVHDVEGRRRMVAMTIAAWRKFAPSFPDVQRKDFSTTLPDGHELRMYWYHIPGTTDAVKPGPVIYYVHGGGMIAGGALDFDGLNIEDVATTGIPLLSVEYRLAPEYPHPVPVEDCYAGLLWLHEHAAELGIDTARIAISGHSAGGGLAAGVTLLARDRKLSPPLAFQMLVYPMLDDRNIKEDWKEPYLMWNTVDNITGWSALVGKDVIGTDKVSQYAAPARATDLSGLPPTYIDVGSLDKFMEEDIVYATKLLNAGVPVELHVYPGVPHGWEAISRETAVTRRAVANRKAAMAGL